MLDFWKWFSHTGNIEAYLYLKALENEATSQVDQSKHSLLD